jgi:uncharacterized protein (TIGR02466 family)
MQMSMSTAPEVLPLFATPLVTFDVPEPDDLNAELRQLIEQREKTHPSTQHSNLGGWQSSWDMDRWGGAAAIRLLAFGRNLANRMTTDSEGEKGKGPYPGYFARTWIANMWANVNRSGHGNEFHSHPGAYWSGVYYVDDGGIGADPSLGGEIEFMDPRGPVPLMNAPHLRMSGGPSAGGTMRLRPTSGRMVIFPAWLLHQVRPYHGGRERISVAFNLTV